MTRAAIVMMAKVLALDGASHGIRVNCLCPGYVEPGMRHMPDRAVGAVGDVGAGYVDPPLPPL
ncbi:MAG: SDR family NAD(P)-dependent oxidoreductase, partial [Candidatus Dormiibacterota bacterium]